MKNEAPGSPPGASFFTVYILFLERKRIKKNFYLALRFLRVRDFRMVTIPQPLLPSRTRLRSSAVRTRGINTSCTAMPGRAVVNAAASQISRE